MSLDDDLRQAAEAIKDTVAHVDLDPRLQRASTRGRHAKLGCLSPLLRLAQLPTARASGPLPSLLAIGFGCSVAAAAWLLPVGHPLERDPLVLVVLATTGTIAGSMLLRVVGWRTVATMTALLLMMSFVAIGFGVDGGIWLGSALLLIAVIATVSWISHSRAAGHLGAAVRATILHPHQERARSVALSDRRSSLAGLSPKVGYVLGGRWSLLADRLPGADQGGLSDLHLVRDLQQPGRVAVAKLPSRLHSDQSRARLTREAELLRACQHSPRVVAMLDSGFDAASGRSFVVLAYHRRGSLAGHLRTTPQFQLGWTVEVAAGILRTLVDLQEGLSRSIVHGDVNPRNVLLRDGATGVVLCDFGVARYVSEEGRTDDAVGDTGGVTVGPVYSPWYGAPELVHGRHAWDPATDIYGAAAVLYELLTGRPPYKRESLMLGLGFEALLRNGVPLASAGEANPDLPRALVHLVDQCLVVHPGDRPARAADVLDRLEQASSGFEEITIPFAELRA
jgi:hypothetical protein